MKPGFLAGLVVGVLVAVAGFVVFDQLSGDADAPGVQQTVQTEQVAPSPVPSPPPVLLAPPAAVVAEPASAEESAAMWLVNDAPPSELPRKRIDVAEAGVLRYDRVALAALKPGDITTVVLPEPARTVSLTVENVSTTAAGNRQIAGSLTGSRLHPFLVTLSAESMFATVGTRAGTYNLRGGASHAWVFTAASLNHNVDPSLPDFRVPPERIRRGSAPDSSIAP